MRGENHQGVTTNAEKSAEKIKLLKNQAKITVSAHGAIDVAGPTLGLSLCLNSCGLLSIFNFLKEACGLGMHNFFKQLGDWDKEKFEFEDRLGETKQKENKESGN